MSQVSVLDNSSSDLKSGRLAEHRLSALANIIPCSNPLAGCIGVRSVQKPGAAVRRLGRGGSREGVYGKVPGWEAAGLGLSWSCPTPAPPHVLC